MDERLPMTAFLANEVHLVDAILRGDEDEVRMHIQGGAKVNSANERPLQKAAEKGNVVILTLLLEAGAKVSADNHYALQLAAKHGKTQAVELLLKWKSDVHADEDTALLWAVQRRRNTPIIRTLIEHGANAYAQDGDIIKWCIDHHAEDELQLLLTSSGEPSIEWMERILKWANETGRGKTIVMAESILHRKKLEERHAEVLAAAPSKEEAVYESAL